MSRPTVRTERTTAGAAYEEVTIFYRDREGAPQPAEGLSERARAASPSAA